MCVWICKDMSSFPNLLRCPRGRSVILENQFTLIPVTPNKRPCQNLVQIRFSPYWHAFICSIKIDNARDTRSNCLTLVWFDMHLGATWILCCGSGKCSYSSVQQWDGELCVLSNNNTSLIIGSCFHKLFLPFIIFLIYLLIYQAGKRYWDTQILHIDNRVIRYKLIKKKQKDREVLMNDTTQSQ